MSMSSGPFNENGLLSEKGLPELDLIYTVPLTGQDLAIENICIAIENIGKQIKDIRRDQQKSRDGGAASFPLASASTHSSFDPGKEKEQVRMIKIA